MFVIVLDYEHLPLRFQVADEALQHPLLPQYEVQRVRQQYAVEVRKLERPDEVGVVRADGSPGGGRRCYTPECAGVPVDGDDGTCWTQEFAQRLSKDTSPSPAPRSAQVPPVVPTPALISETASSWVTLNRKRPGCAVGSGASKMEHKTSCQTL